MDEKKKKELLYRVIAGLILIPIAIYVTVFADRLVFFLIMEVIVLLATGEMVKLVKKDGAFIHPPLMWAGAVAVPAAFYFNSLPALLVTVFLLLFILFLLKMFSENPVEYVIEDVSVSFFSIFFVPFLFSFMLLVRDISSMWLVFLFFVIWASDTFAYFTGSAIGKHKMIPKVSPKKSYEGLAGGFIGAVIVAYLWNYFYFDINILLMGLIAADIIIAGVIGDLVESMLKRSAQVKDSGNLIPGHGGVLDRFDSLLFAAPVLYFYLRFLVVSNG